ncbi:hypothetical protein BKA70DRAFT_1406431 [Coprinopsis sp. MPI-PUGE-AT-0042]|nr:hypothetical protein BKA70DRAFT_1406431 [Coprinopsis sp. MPI-PUGE-AT-0042]
MSINFSLKSTYALLSMTLVDTLIALWSYTTSLWLLVRGNPPHAFAFKYYKAPGTPLATEEHRDGRLEFELTDFTHDVPRWLEMSTLKGVGRLVYRSGSRETTSTFEANTDASSDNLEIPVSFTPPHADEGERSLPSQGGHKPRRGYTTRHNAASPSSSSQQSGESDTKRPKSG